MGEVRIGVQIGNVFGKSLGKPGIFLNAGIVYGVIGPFTTAMLAFYGFLFELLTLSDWEVVGAAKHP